MPSLLTVWVVPGAPRSEVVGYHGDTIKIRIAAPPVGGAANEELARFLAAQLGVPRAAVKLVSGLGGRRKRIEVAGMDLEALEATLLAGKAKGKRKT